MIFAGKFFQLSFGIPHVYGVNRMQNQHHLINNLLNFITNRLIKKHKSIYYFTIT